MTTIIKDEAIAWQIGRTFNIKTADGEVIETTCITWDCDNRVFEATSMQGYIGMDALEYVDQASLGRVELVGIPDGDIVVELF